MQLARYLATNKLSKRRFGRIIGVTEESVRRYCSGERFPTPDILNKIRLATKGAVTANDFVLQAVRARPINTRTTP